MPIGEICSRNVVHCGRETSVQRVAELMRQHHVGAMVVTDETGGRLLPVGIVTDRDVVVEVVAAGLDPAVPTAADLMEAALLTAREDDGLAETLARMRSHGVRRVPVVDHQGTLVGLLSADDALDLLAEEMQALTRLVGRELRRERERRL